MFRMLSSGRLLATLLILVPTVGLGCTSAAVHQRPSGADIEVYAQPYYEVDTSAMPFEETPRGWNLTLVGVPPGQERFDLASLTRFKQEGWGGINVYYYERVKEAKRLCRAELWFESTKGNPDAARYAAANSGDPAVQFLATQYGLNRVRELHFDDGGRVARDDTHAAQQTTACYYYGADGRLDALARGLSYRSACNPQSRERSAELYEYRFIKDGSAALTARRTDLTRNMPAGRTTLVSIRPYKQGQPWLRTSYSRTANETAAPTISWIYVANVPLPQGDPPRLSGENILVETMDSPLDGSGQPAQSILVQPGTAYVFDKPLPAAVLDDSTGIIARVSSGPIVRKYYFDDAEVVELLSQERKIEARYLTTPSGEVFKHELYKNGALTRSVYVLPPGADVTDKLVKDLDHVQAPTSGSDPVVRAAVFDHEAAGQKKLVAFGWSQRNANGKVEKLFADAAGVVRWQSEDAFVKAFGFDRDIEARLGTRNIELPLSWN